ncbi:hypothetical protein Tco_0295032 [Tanacetum coccineum]
MENSKRGSIPMQDKLRLSKSQGASSPAELKRMQNISYASAVGSLSKNSTPFIAEAEYIAAFDASKEAVLVYGLSATPTPKWELLDYMVVGLARSQLEGCQGCKYTAVRGTVGHIAPEYLSTGQSSEKTDVFGFGILLLELITGQRALEFGKAANQKGTMLDWVESSRKVYNFRDGVARSTIQVYLKSWSALYIPLDNVELKNSVLGTAISRGLPGLGFGLIFSPVITNAVSSMSSFSFDPLILFFVLDALMSSVFKT